MIVPAGTYTFPGIELPNLDYTVTVGQTYYVLLDAYIVQSKLPDFVVGNTVQLMFMWDRPTITRPERTTDEGASYA